MDLAGTFAACPPWW